MATVPYYVDGYFRAAREISAIPNVDLQFRNAQNPDIYARTLERSFRVEPSSFDPRSAARTTFSNYVRSSTTFSSPWTAIGVPSHTPSFYNGIVPLDLIADPSGAATNYFSQPLPTLPVGGTWKVQFLVKRASIPGVAQVRLWDSTASAYRFAVRVDTRESGSPVVTAQFGSVDEVVATGVDEIYLVIGSTTSGVVGANSNFIEALAAAPAEAAANVIIGGFGMDTVAAPYIPTTSATRTVTVPDCDYLANGRASKMRSPFHFLVSESNLSVENENAATFKRIYANVPGVQTRSISRSLSKPSPRNNYGSFSGLSIVRFTDGVQVSGSGALIGNCFYNPADQKLYAPMKAVSSYVKNVASGGTFTISFNGGTSSADNYNGFSFIGYVQGMPETSAAGLGTFGGGNTLATGSAGSRIQLSWGSGTTSLPFTLNAGGLTLASGIFTTFTQKLSLNLQRMYLCDPVVIGAHGFDAAKAIVAVTSGGAAYVFEPGEWGIFDSNNILLPSVTDTSTAWVYVGQYKQLYNPGTVAVRMTETTQFYLPGYSVGIATDADIPLPSQLTNDVDFFTALAAGGVHSYDFDAPSQHMGPILKLTTRYLNMANV